MLLSSIFCIKLTCPFQNDRISIQNSWRKVSRLVLNICLHHVTNIIVSQTLIRLQAITCFDIFLCRTAVKILIIITDYLCLRLLKEVITLDEAVTVMFSGITKSELHFFLFCPPTPSHQGSPTLLCDIVTRGSDAYEWCVEVRLPTPGRYTHGAGAHWQLRFVELWRVWHQIHAVQYLLRWLLITLCFDECYKYLIHQSQLLFNITDPQQSRSEWNITHCFVWTQIILITFFCNGILSPSFCSILIISGK